METLKKLWTKIKSYVRPTDLTWWAGIALVTSGVLRYNNLEIGMVTTVIRPILSAYSPGGELPMILAGMGLIGLNAKFARG